MRQPWKIKFHEKALLNKYVNFRYININMYRYASDANLTVLSSPQNQV